VPEVVRDFWLGGRATNLHITLVSEEIGFLEDEVVEVLVGEVVEGSMVLLVKLLWIILRVHLLV